MKQSNASRLLALVAVMLGMAACSTTAGQAGKAGHPRVLAAPGCAAAAPLPGLARPQPGPPAAGGLVPPRPLTAAICQYATRLPAAKAAGLTGKITLRGAAADGLAAVIDNAEPLSGRARLCTGPAQALPLSQVIRFGYASGRVLSVTVTYTTCSVAIVTTGSRAGELTSPVRDDLFGYTVPAGPGGGPATPALTGLDAATAQAVAGHSGFTLLVDGAALDSRARPWTVIFQSPPPGAPASQRGSQQAAVILAVWPSPACTAGQLRPGYRGGGAGAGSDFATIVLRDVAASPCRLPGPLRITGIAADGRPVTTTVISRVSAPGILSPRAAPIASGVPPPPGELAVGIDLIAQYRDDPASPAGLCQPHWVIPAAWRISLPDRTTLTVPNADPAAPSPLGHAGGLVTCRGEVTAAGTAGYLRP